MWQPRGCWVLQLLLLKTFTSAIPELLVRTGTSLAATGDSCTSVYDLPLGFEFFFQLASRRRADLPSIIDRSGTSVSFSLTYTRVTPAACSADAQVEAVEGLLSEAGSKQPVQFLLGSGPQFAFQESAASNAAQRLIYQCCVGPDALYEQDLPYVFGIQASNKKYTEPALKAMALSKQIKTVFVGYRTDNTFTSTTCDAAIKYADVLGQLAEGFRVVQTLTWNSSQGDAPFFYNRTIVDEIRASGADAAILCELLGPAYTIAKAVADSEIHLKSFFITLAPSYPDYVTRLGRDGAQYHLSAGQWHPRMSLVDNFFGSAESYAAAFKEAMGIDATYVAAGASATVYTLWLAIAAAFKNCNISPLVQTSDDLFFNTSMITCYDPVYGNLLPNKTGYEMVRLSLSQLSVDTFFGAVAFNNFRRNIAKPIVVTQIQDGEVEAVLPLDLANAQAVIPVPEPTSSSNRLAQGAIIAIAVCSTAALMAALYFLAQLILRNRDQRRSLLGAVKPPVAGSQATIVVTDIQNSTDLFEQLDLACMDAACSIHHDTIEQAAREFCGFVSATEGDSFILAFHEALDAVKFCTEVQLRLLYASWPEELLRHPSCAPVYVADVSRVAAKDTRVMLKKGFSRSLHKIGSSGTFLQTGRNTMTGRGSFHGSERLSHPGSSSFVDRLTPQQPRRLARQAHTWLASCLKSLKEQVARATGRLGSVKEGGYEDSKRMSHGNVAFWRSADDGEQLDIAVFSATFLGFQLPASHSTQQSRSVSLDMPRQNITLATFLEQCGRHSVNPSSSQYTLAQAPSSPRHGHHPPSPHSSCPPAAAASTDPAAADSGTAGQASLPPSPIRLGVLHTARAASDAGDRAAPGNNAHTASPDVMVWPEQELRIRDMMMRAVPLAAGPGIGHELLFAGLRVRMGMSSGLLKKQDVHYDKVAGRMAYTGPLLQAARDIQDAAPGGQVLADMETIKQLDLSALRATAIVVSMGEHFIRPSSTECFSLYSVLPNQIITRAPHLGPVRSSQEHSAGFLDAPFGHTAVCFMQASGMSALQAWDSEVAEESLAVFQATAQRLLSMHGGYLLEATSSGLFLTAFTHPSAAIRWALATVQDCLESAPWPDELLLHELGEVVAVQTREAGHTLPPLEENNTCAVSPKAQSTVAVSLGGVGGAQLLFRGLRIKVGIDAGPVISDVSNVTARLLYRGRVMNRAARVAGMAKSGNVWVTDAAWQVAQPRINASLVGLDNARAITSQPMGNLVLKGILGEVAVVQCFFTSSTVLPVGVQHTGSSSHRTSHLTTTPSFVMHASATSHRLANGLQDPVATALERMSPAHTARSARSPRSVGHHSLLEGRIASYNRRKSTESTESGLRGPQQRGQSGGMVKITMGEG